MTDTKRYVASHCEEYFTTNEEFETREQAVAYALETLSQEENWDDGECFYTGRVDPVTPLEIVRPAVDADSILERIDERNYEEFGEECPELQASAAQKQDLEEQLAAVIAQWLIVNNIPVPTGHIVAVEDHTFTMCAQLEDPGDIEHSDTCGLAEGHEGDHEYV